MEESGARRVGKYELGPIIGQGGMATVYRARDLLIDRDVAIKMLRPPDAGDVQEASARFLSEAKAVGRLMHPAIVAIFDSGITDDQQSFLVIEWVEGSSLNQKIGRLRGSEVLEILGGVAAGLDYAHSQGVIHRDVKPSNVLLTLEAKPKLTDFGIAKFEGSDESLTKVGLVVGTPRYMSPEQVSGGLVTAASDQFALAAMAFELLTGGLAFEGTSQFETLIAIVTKAPKDPAQLNSTLGAECASIFNRAFAKSPQERFSSCSEFVDRLTEYLKNRSEWKPYVRGLSAAAVPEPTLVGAAPRPAPTTLSNGLSSFSAQSVPVPPPSPRAPAPSRQVDTETRMELPLTVGISVVETAAPPTGFSFQKVVAPGPFFRSDEAHFSEIGNSVSFYRDQLAAEYDALIKQMRVTYVLWLVAVSLAMIVLLLGICLFLFHQVAGGAVTTVSSALLYFLQRVFQQREDNYRRAADAKRATVDYGNQWALVIQTIQGMEDPDERRLREARLVEALTDKLGNGAGKTSGRTAKVRVERS